MRGESLAENAELAEYKGNSIYAEHKRNNICELEDEGPRDSYRSLAEVNSLRKVPQSGTTMPRKKSAPSAKSARATTLRVDTVYIERWHSQIGGEAERLQAREVERIPRFYKNCTWGFFILLLLMIGRIAFKLIKLIYLRR